MLISTGMLALAPFAARADSLGDVIKAKKIRIASEVALPPAGIMDDKMQPIGADVEVARLLSKNWGVNWNSCRPLALPASRTCGPARPISASRPFQSRLNGPR
jgi:ABC-type amino acid transport substrate-binding protein